jgi:hypothetical protein
LRFFRAGRLAAVVLAAVAVAMIAGAAPGDGRSQAADPAAAAPEAGTAAPPPGAKLEVVAASADLFAAPPGLLRDVRARLHNRVGTAARGAELTLVSATADFYEVRLECQDGKVQIEAWIEQKAARPLAPGRPGER